MSPFSLPSLLRTGWFRLWVVVVLALFAALGAVVAYTLWTQDACYRYVSISTVDKLSDEDTILLARLRKESESRTYCGDTEYSTLLTLEQFAKKGIVTQIGVQWQEPKGWSFSDFEMLDVLDSHEIRSSLILTRVHQYVREARLRSFFPWIVSLSVFSIAALLLGLGVAWVRRGFGPQNKP